MDGCSKLSKQSWLFKGKNEIVIEKNCWITLLRPLKWECHFRWKWNSSARIVHSIVTSLFSNFVDFQEALLKYKTKLQWTSKKLETNLKSFFTHMMWPSLIWTYTGISYTGVYYILDGAFNMLEAYLRFLRCLVLQALRMITVSLRGYSFFSACVDGAR